MTNPTKAALCEIEGRAAEMLNQLVGPHSDTALRVATDWLKQEHRLALSQPSPASSTAGEVRKLETVIAKAYQAARDAPELNMSNYDEDDVSALNNAMIEVYQILASLSPSSGEPASNGFEREERFIVIKRKHLSGDKEADLRMFLNRHRIGTAECVVVESDWPEYETVWQMIESRMKGEASA